MRKISKKTLQRIKEGYHSDLMEAIEFLLETYNENKFDAGYCSCLADMAVRSQRLADHIKDSAPTIGHKPRKGEEVHVVEVGDLAKVIIEYFNEALNKE
jgi:hypothetical protein